MKLMRNFLWVIAPLGLVLIGVACGTRTGVTEVSGVVRYKGAPLPGGTLIFLGGPDNAPTRTLIGHDGTYRLANSPTGLVKIAVEGPAAPSGKPGAKPAVVVPASYTKPDTSGLTYTVTEGAQVHDIELK